MEPVYSPRAGLSTREPASIGFDEEQGDSYCITMAHTGMCARRFPSIVQKEEKRPHFVKEEEEGRRSRIAVNKWKNIAHFVTQKKSQYYCEEDDDGEDLGVRFRAMVHFVKRKKKIPYYCGGEE